MTTAEKTPRVSTHRFIGELQPGEQITDDIFLVSQKDLRSTTNGGLYIHLVLVDRSGQLLSRIWNATQEMYATIPEGGFIRVRGRAESYKGNLQFIIDGIRPATPDLFDVADFLPATKQDVDELWNRVLKVLRTIKNPALLELIKAFVKDESIVTAMKRAPAAVQNHHAYIGGLLEHTCSLLELGVRIFGASGDPQDSHYPEVNRDLVLAGLFFHDIGKINELAYETNFVYATAGQLLGHITQAAILIDRKASEIERESGKPFPRDLLEVLTHIVLAHHGTYEFGSPRLPACPEALIVHHLDNIDAKLNMAFSCIEESKNEPGDWTEYFKPLGTRIYKKHIGEPQNSIEPRP